MRRPLRLPALLAAAIATAAGVALVCGVAAPPARAQDAPKPPAGDAKGAAPADDPSKLPDEEKAKRLSAIDKEYEDLRRNQDLVQVRTRRNGVHFVGDMRYAPAAKYLKKVFDDDRDLSTRVAALIAIGKCGDAPTIEYAVKRALADAKGTPVFAASLPRMYANVTDLPSREFIATRLAQKEDDVVASVVEAVGFAGLDAALPELTDLLGKSRSDVVRFECLRAIGRCGRTKAVSLLLPYLSDADWKLRMAAAEGLGFAGQQEAIPEIAKLVVRHEEPIVVETAVEALARLGTKAAMEPLIESLKLGRLRARQKARTALRSLALSLNGHEKDYGVDPNAWGAYWKKVKAGVSPDDPSFAQKETASYFHFPIHSDRVLFILDVSGSMQWPDPPRDSGIKPADWDQRRIDIAHRELYKALRALAEQNQGRIPKKSRKNETTDTPWAPTEEGVEPPTLFNVATFSGVVMPWGKEAVLATKENVEAAIAWLDKQLPRGGTATFDAISFGLQQPNIDTVYFLSDGVPSLGKFEERETILAEVRKMNRFQRVSIHTVALIIGLSPIESARKYEDPNDMAELMGRLATENQGEFANESKL